MRHSTRLTRRQVSALALALLVAGCSSWGTTVRLKLTFEVEVDGEIKTASNVIEYHVYEISFPESAARTATTGEAVYVDLGEARKPLVAILNVHRNTGVGPSRVGPWGLYGPLVAYGVISKDQSDASATAQRRLKQLRGPRELTLDLLPQLVTFEDRLDPNTVELVDPHNLEAALGSDVKWHRVTVEVTDEDISIGVIAERLPWLKTMDGNDYLDGRRTKDRSTLASKMQRFDFIKRGV